MKEELLKAISNVSGEEFVLAAERFFNGFNAKSMVGNFISILEEYSEDY